jgi:hypothetical protein
MVIMKSPFPGMDPYLERHWLDVHTKLVTYSADALNTRLPPELIARTQERIAIESEDDVPDRLAPDVRVLEAVQAMQSEPSSSGSAMAVAPYRLVALIEPITERFIEIIEATGERLVTVIEFPSPTNKRGEGLKAFRSKREKVLAGRVNFVEIDLVRTGDWRKLLRPHSPRRGTGSPYRATVRAIRDPEAVYYYPMSLREPLPAIRIPLRRDDPQVDLQLQPLVEQAYANGRYARPLDYSKPPDPPLDTEDAAWAEEVLKAAGKIPGS